MPRPGGALVVGEGIPAAWVTAGGLNVKRLPTHYGVLNLTMTPDGPDAVRVYHFSHEAYLRGHTIAGEVCELEGAGPVPVQVVRALACGDVLVKALVTERVGPDTCFIPFHYSGWWQGHDMLAYYPDGAAPIVRGEAVNTATTYGYDRVTMMQETKTTLCNVAKA